MNTATLPEASSRQPTLRSLQALRFIAAAMVLVGHVLDNLRRGRIPGLAEIVDLSGMPWHAGVDIFFVVSGFVMYLTMSQKFGRPGIMIEFLRRRLIRVAPFYWLFTLLAVGTALLLPGRVHHNDLSWSNVLASLLFIPWRTPYGDLIPPLSVGWTLNLEVFFYVLFAMALIFPKRIGLGLLVLTFLALIGIKPFVPPGLADQFILWGNKIILEFLFGIAAAHCYVSGTRLPLTARVGLVIAALALLSAGNLAGYNAFRDRWFFWGVPAAMMVVAFVLGSDLPDRRWSRWLVLAGDASYALYLSHLFTLRLVALVGTRIYSGNSPVYLVLACAASIAASIALHLVVEKPMHKYLLGLNWPVRWRADPSARNDKGEVVRGYVEK